jgi:hypothetical protein
VCQDILYVSPIPILKVYIGGKIFYTSVTENEILFNAVWPSSRISFSFLTEITL